MVSSATVRAGEVLGLFDAFSMPMATLKQLAVADTSLVIIAGVLRLVGLADGVCG
jgi:hypothetical protein